MLQGDDSNPLLNKKVSCPNLKELTLYEVVNITALCSHQVPTDHFCKLETLEIFKCGKLRNLMPLPMARSALSLRVLKIEDCPSIKEVICKEELLSEETTGVSIFSGLEELEFKSLPKLEHFIATDQVLKFSFLKKVMIEDCPEMKSFLLDRVLCPNLEELKLRKIDNITVLCSYQLSAGYFSKLETLEVNQCEKLRNLTSLTAARGFLNLRVLTVGNCPSIEEVIKKEELGEVISNESLFPRLEELRLCNVPKLKYFCLTKLALEFPFLRQVCIFDCPEMKTFTLGSVNTPRIERVWTDIYVEVKDDLKKIIQLLFNSKEQEASSGDESKATDGRNKYEAAGSGSNSSGYSKASNTYHESNA